MYNGIMNIQPITEQEKMQARLDARCEKRRDKKKQMTPFWSLGEELAQGVRQHWNCGVTAPLTLVVEDTGIWLAEFLLRKQRNETTDNLWFVSSFTPDVEWVQERGCNARLVCYNDPIAKIKKILMGLTFDNILGNPPFNGKSSIHLKMVGLMQGLLKENGVLGLILPKPILVRQSERTHKYTAWLDTCTMIEWQDIDMKQNFPTVGDDLIWFMVKNDGGHKMTDLTVQPPAKTWSGRYVTGLDFSVCKKKPEGEYTVPVINAIGPDAKPIFGKFTSPSSLAKIAAAAGKPTLHINGIHMTHKGRVPGVNLSWLDERGEHAFYRHYMLSIVFDDVLEARACQAWINSEEGCRYFAAWYQTHWAFGTAIKHLIASV